MAHPGSIFVLGWSPEGGNGNLLQCSCLENPIERGAWRATVYGLTKSLTWLSNWACMLHSTNWGPRTEGHTSLERRITANIDGKKQKEHHYEILEHKSIENLIFFCICHLKNNKNRTYFELLNIDCQSRTPCPIKLSLIWGRLYILSVMEELRKVNSQPSLFLTSHFLNALF